MKLIISSHSFPALYSWWNAGVVDLQVISDSEFLIDPLNMFGRGTEICKGLFYE
jgi:hypothetical protein